MAASEGSAVSSAEQEDSLRRLHYWLRYEGLTGLFGGTVIWLPFGFVSSILVVMAIIFTPYMLWHLWRAGWRTWIPVFCAIVVAPALVALLLESQVNLGYYFLAIAPLVLFYAYTWTLRYVIGEHLAELDALRMFERKDRGIPV